MEQGKPKHATTTELIIINSKSQLRNNRNILHMKEKTIYKDKKATDEEKIPLNPICCFYICIYLLILQEERMVPRSENRTIICSQSIIEPFPITPDPHGQHGAGWASLYSQTGMYHRTRMPKISNSGIM